MTEMNKAAAGPLVSVVTPVYNMEPFLGEMLDSVLASDYPQLEVVLVDDGSTDASAAVARAYAARDSRVRLHCQCNGGACRARNKAVELARGELILPVDADNRLEPDFISKAVAVLAARPEVKAVAPGADFFGDRSGPWKLPPFSLRLLARKNILSASALYRREDWVRAGGYCEEIVAREDWEFWISVLKDGGTVVRLPDIGLHYRIRNRSKRVKDRGLKRHVVRTLNRLHPEFFERELGGPLRYRRTWSALINRVERLLRPRRVTVSPDSRAAEYFVRSLPVLFRTGRGRVIHSGRNELRELDFGGETYVVKSFRVPNLVNRIAYGLLRASKAQRSYEYALRLRACGIGSPAPVAWMTLRNGLLLTRSYYVSRKSGCPYTYSDLIGGGFPDADVYLRAIARTTALLHEQGMLHKDYSRGNILFGPGPDGRPEVEIIDLNRIRFRRRITMEEGCRNFAERLPATPAMRAVMAAEYARTRGFDSRGCLELMERFNVEKK